MKNELKKKKRKGKIVLSAQEDKNLEENLRENDKKSLELDRLKVESQKAF